MTFHKKPPQVTQTVYRAPLGNTSTAVYNSQAIKMNAIADGRCEPLSGYDSRHTSIGAQSAQTANFSTHAADGGDSRSVSLSTMGDENTDPRRATGVFPAEVQRSNGGSAVDDATDSFRGTVRAYYVEDTSDSTVHQVR
eukprot:PhF_6_TR10527/c0_g1_i1/m.16569